MSNVREFYLPVGGSCMNIIRFGTGKKNLLIISGISLCGLEGQGEGVAAAYAQFAQDYTVYLFDRRKELPKEFRVEDMAEDIYAVCKMEGIEEADVFGVSQGGMIAQWLAIEYPSLVRKLVLCSTQCRVTEKMQAFCRELMPLIRKKDVVELNRCFFRKVYSPAFLERNREYLPMLEKQGTPADCERLEILVNACAVFDIFDRMGEIRCPVLALGDVNDDTIGVEGTYEIIRALNCSGFIYDNYSHAVYDEAPDIKDKIQAFLNA